MNFKFVRPIGQELRPFNHHIDLLKALGPYLETRNHHIVDSILNADAVLFDSEIWDRSDTNPSLPKGSYSSYSQGDLNHILNNKIPIVFFDCFDHRGTPTHHCTWPGKNNWEDCKNNQDWGRFMFEAKDRCQIIYFMRKMQLSVDYPPWVYPLEYPLFNDFPLATRAELSARPYDVCFLGETGHVREKAIAGIKADGRLRADLEHVPCNKRTTLEDWIARHRNSKTFLEIDNTMGSERPMRLMTVAPMVRVKSDHKIPVPRVDMVHHIEIGDYDGTVTPSDIDKVLAVVRDPDKLYSIYTAGALHMKSFYSLEARNFYIVCTIEKELK